MRDELEGCGSGPAVGMESGSEMSSISHQQALQWQLVKGRVEDDFHEYALSSCVVQ